ncbi:MAG TPA: hypothetical protein VKH34_15220 [Vicinamibacterales bacterium]|nr:hypothetical protein [Vicinamibacterales bacterium]
MKAAAIAGIVLIAIGIYVVAGQASYKSDKEVLKIGGLAASVTESRSIPPWAGAIAIAVGGVLVFAGLRGKK